jgi:hypothetical protein
MIFQCLIETNSDVLIEQQSKKFSPVDHRFLYHALVYLNDLMSGRTFKHLNAKNLND